MGIKVLTTTLEKVRDRELKTLRKQERTNITCETETRRHKLKGKMTAVPMFVIRSEDAK